MWPHSAWSAVFLDNLPCIIFIMNLGLCFTWASGVVMLCCEMTSYLKTLIVLWMLSLFVLFMFWIHKPLTRLVFSSAYFRDSCKLWLREAPSLTDNLRLTITLGFCVWLHPLWQVYLHPMIHDTASSSAQRLLQEKSIMITEYLSVVTVIFAYLAVNTDESHLNTYLPVENCSCLWQEMGRL